MDMEMKTIRCSFLEVKAVDNGERTFSGYGAVFGNVDSYGDVIAKGAFAKSIAEFKAHPDKWPAMLEQHGGWHLTAKDNSAVGVWTEIREDDHGLYVEGKLADIERGRELYTLMTMQPRPALNGLSIGYIPTDIGDAKVDGKTVRLLKGIDLIEISLVTFPANGEARVSHVKDGSMPSIRDAEAALRDAGFSRSQAKAMLAGGYKALSLRDADDGDAGIAALLRRNINALSGKKEI